MRTVKSTLRKVLGKKSLTFEELATVLCEAEAVINSRPLTTATEDELEEPLTPNHLIYGRKILKNRFEHTTTIPEEFSSKRCRFIKTTLSHFWNRFRKEYLGELRQKHIYNQTKTKQPIVNLGDVVLIKDDIPTPRSQWKLGRIEQIIRGADEVIRGVKLTSHSKQGRITTVHRPIQKIIPFEVVKNQPRTQSVSKGSSVDVVPICSRNKRRAALIGEQTRRLRDKHC